MAYSSSDAICLEMVYSLMPFPTVLPYFLEHGDFTRTRSEVEQLFKDVASALLTLADRRRLPDPIT